MKTYNSLLIVLITSFVTCQTIDKESVEQQLLRSNELQRQAHLEGDALLLVNEIADPYVSMQGSKIDTFSNEQMKDRFEDYFKTVEYTSWDDIIPPVIEISPKGNEATMQIRKFLDIQMVNSNGEMGEHQFSSWSWQSKYVLINDRWKVHSISDSHIALTAEEAADLHIANSTVYAEIDERDLIPEGVAFDPVTNTTYVSSTYKQKIVGLRSDGSHFDFQQEAAEGLWSTVGMEVDADRRKLWVVSSNVTQQFLPMKNPDPENEWTSRIYEYDLDNPSNIIIHRPNIEGEFSFNDITVSTKGEVYTTESVQNKVYHLHTDTKTFTELPIADALFQFANGITLSDDEKYLYVSCTNGILQLTLADISSRFLLKHEAIDDTNIDGLAYYKGSLIANQPYRNRILQFVLNENEGSIRHQKILEANHPAFDQPSTGEIVGDSFIYLANAQMQSGFKDGKIREASELEPVVLLKVKLWDYSTFQS